MGGGGEGEGGGARDGGCNSTDPGGDRLVGGPPDAVLLLVVLFPRTSTSKFAASCKLKSICMAFLSTASTAGFASKNLNVIQMPLHTYMQGI